MDRVAIVGIPLSGRRTVFGAICGAKGASVRVEHERIDEGVFKGFEFPLLIATASGITLECVSGSVPIEGCLPMVRRSSRFIFVYDAQPSRKVDQIELWSTVGPLISNNPLTVLVNKIDLARSVVGRPFSEFSGIQIETPLAFVSAKAEKYIPEIERCFDAVRQL